ncbi:hypothetical protein HPB48_019446 [Haemaphysalis longicornis]|uniref:Uncharacterized protein n=1 Tax=Haemaphysalis longicornis TaxID=44386 RepID=A0A9J6FZP9_HAELO|nr:hypothetical protein HPB48_019446 [Haemaphysalis longicornis]
MHARGIARPLPATAFVFVDVFVQFGNFTFTDRHDYQVMKGWVHQTLGYIPNTKILFRRAHQKKTRILFARPMGRSNTILVTFEGLRVPRDMLFHRTAMRFYPHRPRTILCLNCMVIGHKSEVCPKKGITATCPNCGGIFPANPGLRVAHSCATRCYNYKG